MGLCVIKGNDYHDNHAAFNKLKIVSPKCGGMTRSNPMIEADGSRGQLGIWPSRLGGGLAG